MLSYHGNNFMISIHASAKEATRITGRNGTNVENFNPRFREGSDSKALEYLNKAGLISIHASAKEATAKTTNIIKRIFKILVAFVYYETIIFI